MEETSISIPLLESNGSVVVFPDELPADHNKLINLFRAELAPLNSWKTCAVEYHRQGNFLAFELIIKEILDSLKDSDVDKMYRERPDYNDGISSIYVTLAAQALSKLLNSASQEYLVHKTNEELEKIIVEYLNLADDRMKINEYVWIIKGFYEILQGDLKRAGDHFRSVFERSNKTQAERKLLFGSLIGQGFVNFLQQKYDAALEYFSKALLEKPSCGAKMRMAISYCCFMLQQYDRAKAAADVAISMEPNNANLLLILTLLEHIQAKTDRSNRIKHRTHALEYCTLAAAIDPKNANVLNQLANHYFHSWKVLVASDVASEMVFVLNENHLALHRRCATSSSPGDHFRINGLSVNFVLLEVLEERLLIRFSDQLQALGGVPTDYTVYRFKNSFSKYQLIQSTVTALETKELAMAERYAAEAIKCTMLSVIKAESYFIIGKINHIRRNPEAALEYYRLSLQENSDMILAAYGAAQILLSKQEFDHSLDFFEKVLQKNPLDKDTQAYVMLLKAIRKKEDANFDKLREIVPGFQFEIDLWLIQGQIKQRNNSEHLNALKCYLYAKEGMERRKTPVPPTILSNMAVLYHSLGKMEKALEYSKLAIIKSGKSQSANLKCSLSLSNAEFEGVFFVWSPIEEKATISREDGNHFRIQDLSAKQPVSIGDTIIIGNVAMVIEDIDGDNFRVASPLNLLSVECQGEIDSPKNMFDVQIRTPLNNFTDSTLTYCYNFARLLEDAGHSKPAFDLYVELLKHHPSFIECYLRLSVLACNIGKFDDSSMWLTRALLIDPDEPDVNICLGDLYTRSSRYDEAKKCYEKVCNKMKHDARSMLSLGNMYFANSLNLVGEKKQTALKDSYKFFYHVLNNDKSNAYAATGLGMVCSEKDETVLAREIFAKARETDINTSEDICANLANAQLLASRFLDAEHLYQAAVVGISKNITREKLSYLCDCSSLAQLSNDRTDDAVFSLLKSISFDPDHFQSWYNLAVLRKVSATKNNKISATELEQAIFDLQFASEIFERLLNFHKTAALDKKMLAKQRTLSTINVVKLKEQLETVREVEQKKKVSREKQELEHSAAIQRKKDETLKLHIMLEESKKEQQKIAKERDNRRIRDDSAPFPEANEGLSDDESIEKLLGKRKISESE